jgi:hypothetical protein
MTNILKNILIGFFFLFVINCKEKEDLLLFDKLRKTVWKAEDFISCDICFGEIVTFKQNEFYSVDYNSGLCAPYGADLGEYQIKDLFVTKDIITYTIIYPKSRSWTSQEIKIELIQNYLTISRLLKSRNYNSLYTKRYNKINDKFRNVC